MIDIDQELVDYGERWRAAQPPLPPDISPVLRSRARRPRRVLIGAVIVVVLAVGGVTFIATRSDRSNLTVQSSGGSAPNTRLPRLSSRLVLPSRVVTAGSSISATVVVDNNTGHALTSVGCGGLFQVALANASYAPEVLGLRCREILTVPAGESKVPVTISAMYLSCVSQRPPGGRACLPDGKAPPLPTGRYEATVIQNQTNVPTPKAVPVRVVAAVATP